MLLVFITSEVLFLGARCFFRRALYWCHVENYYVSVSDDDIDVVLKWF